MNFIFSKLPLRKWHQKALNFTPNSSNIFPKLSYPSAKSFASSDHKAYKNQKSSKKIQQGSYLQKKPTSHFNLVRHFFPFCLALLNRMGTYPKVQMGKRRRYGWMHEGSKINSISFCISYDEVGARKKTSSTNNIQFFWKSYFTQMVELNKTKLSFHFEYIIIFSHVFIEILFCFSKQKKKNKGQNK